jgi:hypothetical protein
MGSVRLWVLLASGFFATGLLGCLGPPLELPAARPSGAPTDPGQPGQRERLRLSLKPARAFVVDSAGELLKGPAADGRVGDFALDNGLVTFIVARADQAIGFADSGGHVIDAGPSGGQDGLVELFDLTGPQFPRQALYQSVVPGMRGRAALLRAAGHDSEDPSLEIITDYVLDPGARFLEIDTRYTNRGASALDKLPVGDAIQWGRVERFIPGEGFALEASAPRELTTSDGWLGGISPEVSYAYVVAGALAGKHGVGWSDVTLAQLSLAPGATGEIKRWLVVGSTADASLSETVAELRGEEWARIGGRVVEDGTGAPVGDARLILADRNGRPLAVARAQNGSYALLAPPGDYLVGAESAGRRGPQHLEVKLGTSAATTLDVLVSRPGAIDFRVDEAGRASPAKLTLIGVPPTRTPDLGTPASATGGNIALTTSGRGTLALPPGHYHVIASRGPLYTVDDQEVEVRPEAAAQLSFRLSRAIDWPGLTCADLHQHAAPSADSAVSLDDRVAANLAEGLDIEVATDHNVIVDYAPALARSGGALGLIAGEEATREGVGHFNAWPMPFDADAPRGGAVDVRGKNAHQILGELRAPDRVVQVDHPRSGTIGYFNLVGLDAQAPQLPKDWEGGFDALEIFSGKDPAKTDQPIADWMALTNRGLVYTGVGGSDSHLVWGQEVGYPRTCVFLDDKHAPKELVHAIRDWHDALVTNGPFIAVTVGGHRMGELAPAPRGRARLEVEVRAAPWVDTRRLEVWVNGERRGKPLDLGTARGMTRYKGAFDLKIDRDSSVVVIVRGDASLEPVVSRPAGAAAPTPLAVTNPIFLDRDGDGRFTAPNAPARPGSTSRPTKTR